jgi:hypothetical protein
MRELLLNQPKLIEKENPIMLVLAILGKISALKSETLVIFVHKGISFYPGPNRLKTSIAGGLALALQRI